MTRSQRGKVTTGLGDQIQAAWTLRGGMLRILLRKVSTSLSYLLSDALTQPSPRLQCGELEGRWVSFEMIS